MTFRRSSSPGVLAVAALSFGAVLTACSSSATSSSVPSSVSTSPAATGTAPASGAPASSKPPTPDHVVVVVFENKAEKQVTDNSAAPYFNALAARGASFTNWTAITHPSQPNYLAMFSGSTQGVADDSCLAAGAFKGPDLGGELLAAGKTFAGYAEAMPSDGFTGCAAGRYAAKHNPWKDFADVPASASHPFSAFPTDYTKLPTVSFVIPDMCDDMHDCPVATGDAWLKAHLGAYADWAANHHSLLVVTWDEDDFGEANVIPTTIVGAGVKPGVYTQKADHYAFLRTLEDMYQLPQAGASAQAAPLAGLWTTAS